MKLPRRSPIRSSIPNISNLSDIFKDLFLENSCVNFRPKAKFRKFSAGLYEKSSPFFSLRDIMIFIVFISKLLEFGSCMQTQHTKEKKKPFPKQQPPRLSRNGHNIMLCFHHCTLLQKRGCDLPGHVTNN